MADGKTIRVWRVPTLQGGECVFRQLDAATGSAVSFNPNLGGSCHITPGRTQPKPVLATLAWVARDHGDGYYLILQGSLAPGAARVELVSDGGETPIEAKGRDFVLALSDHAAAGSIPSPLASAAVEVADVSGTVTDRVALKDLLPPAGS
jgi:hypothetical protein